MSILLSIIFFIVVIRKILSIDKILKHLNGIEKNSKAISSTISNIATKIDANPKTQISKQMEGLFADKIELDGDGDSYIIPTKKSNANSK